MFYDYIDIDGNPEFYSNEEAAKMTAMKEDSDMINAEEIADRDLADLDRNDDGWQPLAILDGLLQQPFDFLEMQLNPLGA